MPAHHEPSRIFGIVQGAVLVVVIGTAILYRRRQKLMEKDVGANMTADPRSFIRRTPVHQTGGAAPEDAAKARPEPAAKLETTFPSWTKETPPHVILGLKPGATSAEIESAYKVLLKRFHPDRFASWGGGYQTRAHHVIILVQDARDKLLSGK